MSQPTPTYQLIEERLGNLPRRSVPGDGTLAEFVRARRPLTPPASWRQIAAEIKELTGVTVSHESLRAWFGAEDRQRVPTPLPDDEAARLREMVARAHGGSTA